MKRTTKAVPAVSKIPTLFTKPPVSKMTVEELRQEVKDLRGIHQTQAEIVRNCHDLLNLIASLLGITVEKLLRTKSLRGMANIQSIIKKAYKRLEWEEAGNE